MIEEMRQCENILHLFCLDNASNFVSHIENMKISEVAITIASLRSLADKADKCAKALEQVFMPQY